MSDTPNAPGVRKDMTGWTAAEDARLTELWARTDPVLSTAAIGREMGKTKNAIIGRSKRINLPRRESPIASTSSTRSRPLGSAVPPPNGGIPRAPKITLPPFQPRSIPLVVYASPSVRLDPPPDLEGDERIDLRRMRLERASTPKPRVRKCCWPTGEGRAIRFECADPVTRGSYCADHAARAYGRVSEKMEFVPRAGAFRT